MANGFEMRCVYMMTDENRLTKILQQMLTRRFFFGIMRQSMYMTEEKVYIEGAGQALVGDKRHIL